ncbi:dTDP-4-dehydrorhamnose 3,5-epimerase [Afipia massiliensis]|uniref:dTDP-4-dehydrorhamnose 3,5-epimerase n=1 Tax=Afipia massiliensis TaxID=211460 RepID=A0A4V6Y1F1_9BRAD|nr:dTDP-4-dehydrorhamnose 3,5-epimerase [Afipia massiliensis]TKT72903.1 dTDP-4-dehydrorhamnose 3,5-epimerase [Afipia massiliensis]
MKATLLTIPDIVLLEPRVFEDDRGLFFESYSLADFQAATNCALGFVQDNHSKSSRNVLRGLHYQIGQPQGKLIRVIRGEIFDVAIDIRRSSPFFGQWVGEFLSAENKRQMWIPPGFAHGYLAISDAECLYKTTDYYAPEQERCISWNDPTISIDWPLSAEPILSAKDRLHQPFADAQTYP